jgi:hypothetical protein
MGGLGLKLLKPYIKAAFTCLVILGLLCVFFSPLVQLEPTALRAARMASALLLSFAALAAVVAAAAPSYRLHLAHSRDCSPPVPIIELDCARLC